MFQGFTPGAALTRFLYVAVPKILLGAGTVGLNLMLMRHLGAEQFGILSLCITAILMTDSIAGSAFDYTVLKLAPVEGSEGPAVHAAAFQLKALIAATLLVISVAFFKVIDGLVFHNAAGLPVIAVTTAAAGAVLLLRSAQTWLQSREDFRAYGMMDLVHLCLRLGGVSVLAAAGLVTPLSAMSVFLLAALLPLTVWAAGRGRVVPLFVSRGDLRRRVVADAKWMLLTFAIGALISRLDLALVAHYAGLREAGLYSAAQVLALTIQLVGIYLSVVLTPKISPLIYSGAFHAFFRMIQTGVLATAVVGFAVILGVRPFIGSVLLPPAYAHSVDVIYVLVPGALAGFTMFPLTIGYLMFVRPRFLFTMDCVSLPVLIVGAALVVPVYGAIGAGFLSSSIHVIRAVIATAAAWSRSAASQGAACPDQGKAEAAVAVS